MRSLSTQRSPAFSQVRYPGELGAGPVGVAFEIPDGWSTAPVHGALAQSWEPVAGAEGFVANVVTSIDRVKGDAVLGHIADQLLHATRAGAAMFEIARERIVDVAGVPAIVREQAVLTDATPISLVQFVLVLLVDVAGGMGRDCVQITASIDHPRRDDMASMFDHLVSSVVLDA